MLRRGKHHEGRVKAVIKGNSSIDFQLNLTQLTTTLPMPLPKIQFIESTIFIYEGCSPVPYHKMQSRPQNCHLVIASLSK